MKINFENIINKKYKNLLITEILGKDNHGRTMAECKCDCGNNRQFPVSRILKGDYKSCGCRRYRRGNNSPTFKGYEEITGILWNQIKHNAKRRGHKFEIKLSQAWDLFLKQNKKCALSGLKLTFGSKNLKEEVTASLDRIDSSKGYTVDNIQWLHKNINWMKQDFSQDEFVNYCKLIATTI